MTDTRKFELLNDLTIRPRKTVALIVRLNKDNVEVITSHNVQEKAQYIAKAYDDNLHLIANPKIRIVDWATY